MRAVLSFAVIFLLVEQLLALSLTSKPPIKCGLYEVYSQCGNNACQNTCANPNVAPICKPACQSGCICADGYLKNSKNVCVIPEKCDTCKENEIFSKCDNHGCQNTCSEPDLLPRCSYVAGCYPGCICKPGYLRNTKGVCVPEKQCVKPQCTGPYEEYSECGNDSCQKTCESFNANVACRPSCNPGCICLRGFIRNSKGVCIDPTNCENEICPRKNEAYNGCVSPCGETCANLGQNITCNFLVCNGGCDCKPGFYRNSKGDCVSPDECDCPENEEKVACPNSCPPETCDSIGKLFKCAVVDPTQCKPQCKCVLNYKRDENGECGHISKCPQPYKCNEHEVYDSCPNNCRDQTCDGGQSCEVDSADAVCRPKCVCEDGYLRNSEGLCIPKGECAVSCGGDPNAEHAICGDTCPVTCNNKDLGPRLCPQYCLKEGGCRCKTGYVRNIRNKCILPEECPKCGANEFFNCGSACDTTCETLGQTCPIVNIVCNEKCYCIDGYARDIKNVCIPIKQCPPKTCPINQVYNLCPIYCPPEETCDDNFEGRVYDCARAPEDRKCIPRCECKPGFIRRERNGDCVKPGKCCKDPNAEVVECPNPCPGGTCASPAFQPCKVLCRPKGCQCKKGYVKDILGKCILLSNCR